MNSIIKQLSNILKIKFKKASYKYIRREISLILIHLHQRNANIPLSFGRIFDDCLITIIGGIIGRDYEHRTLSNRGCDAPFYGRDRDLHGGRWWRAPSATPALESSGNVAYVLVAQSFLHHVTTRHLGFFRVLSNLIIKTFFHRVLKIILRSTYDLLYEIYLLSLQVFKAWWNSTFSLSPFLFQRFSSNNYIDRGHARRVSSWWSLMAEATRITIDSPIDHLTPPHPNFLSSFRSPLIEAQRSKRSCVPLSLSLERISNCCIDIDWSEWVNFRVAGYRKRRFRSPIGSCVYMCLYIYIRIYVCI